MATRQIITLSSGEDDDGVEIISVTKRRKRKRRKISHSTPALAQPGNKDGELRDTTITAPSSSAIAQSPTRARSADILTSSFDTLLVLDRSRSAPQDHIHTTQASTCPEQTLPETSLLEPCKRPCSPVHPTFGQLGCQSTSTLQQAYPKPQTIRASFGRHQIRNHLSNRYVAPQSNIPGFRVRESGSRVDEKGRKSTPESICTSSLQDQLGRATGTEALLNPVLGNPWQVGRKNGNSTEGIAPGQSSEVFARPLHSNICTSRMPTTEGGRGSPSTKDAVDRARGPSSPNDRPGKRKLHSIDVEPPLPQPRPRNRILWSTPAFKESKNDHIGASPLNSATVLAGSSDAPSQSTTQASQEPEVQKPRRTWTCKIYADLAQQLQHSFPFAEFAKKHSRSQHEVFDLFSAVVHLPLLQKSSTGLSRVTPQGRNSVRSYRSLMKETKSELAKEGQKKARKARKPAVSLESPSENQGPKKAAVKTPSKDSLDTALKAKNSVDVR